ncbi:cytochrome c-type biogenesis protein CcmH [Deinococcus altitudinis]|uniref:cytochrome c-type biogenesis protein n=1 Tax=Deinococcus altitudinis TaxID=468914 RepID=UPI0038925095
MGGGRWGRLLALLLALVCTFSLAQTGTTAGAPILGTTLTATQEAQAQAIGRTIRCPVCQGLPITESPSDLSQQMLRELREQVVAGQNADQITGYFAARYGDTVLLDPPRRGVNLLLWFGPLAALLLGGWWLLGYLKRARGAAVPTEDADDTDESDDYLAQVKAQVAHGKPS